MIQTTVDRNLKKKNPHNWYKYDSDIPVTLSKGQGHQIWYELLVPKQGYNHTKFDSLSPFSNVRH